MKTIRIDAYLSIGYANANRNDLLEIEVDDNATLEQIEKEAEQAVNDWSSNFIDLGFEILD